MMFDNILTPDAKEILKSVVKDSLPKSTYLAGRTAIAMHLGHRKSLDLDFFTPHEFNEMQWEQKLIKDWGFKLAQKDWQTLIGRVHKTKFSLFYYKYKLIGKTQKVLGISIASLADLSAMKLDTVMARGTKRDFIDLYFLAQKFGLKKMFDFFDEKYGNLEERVMMMKKALLYFEEADKDEMPDMLTEVDWGKVKDFFEKFVFFLG